MNSHGITHAPALVIRFVNIIGHKNNYVWSFFHTGSLVPHHHAYVVCHLNRFWCRYNEHLYTYFCNPLVFSIPSNTRRWANFRLILDQRWIKWTKIKTALAQRRAWWDDYFLLYIARYGSSLRAKQTSKHETSTQCWANVATQSTTLAQHWVDASWLLWIEDVV